MTIFRVKKDKSNPYVMIHKGFLEDSKISLKLKGFLAYCLSKPDDWKFHIRQLASVLKEGKDALYSIVDEGIEHGYIEREPQKKIGKFESNNYIIHEIKNMSTVSGFPDTELPDTESQTLLSIKEPKLTKEVVCVPEAPPKPPAGKISKFKSNGDPFKLDLSDFYRTSMQNRKKWTTEELQKAWDILEAYDGPVNDWYKFVEGTIDNLRQKDKISSLKTVPSKTGMKKELDLCKKRRETSPEEMEKYMKELNEGPDLMTLLCQK